jgi:hypothetical protein
MTDRAKVILLEIICLLVIAGSIALIAVPKMDDLKRRNTAEGVLADVEDMRNAVYSFYSDSAYFPAETPGRAIPPGLGPYLPRGFVTNRPYGSITYKNWPGDARPAPTDTVTTGPDVQPPQRARAARGDEGVSTSNVIGAVILANDPKVVATAAALTPRTARFVVRNRYTFLLFGT